MAARRYRPIYLIVATSTNPPLGIGLCGKLPWPPIKADMSFFKRVTTRPPPPCNNDTVATFKNAVIMGRKTWDSIPPKFRPLRDRVNVVVSRSKTALELSAHSSSEDVLVTSHLVEAISALEGHCTRRGIEVGKSFIIGGSEIYRAAMEELVVSHDITLRIIQTQVRRKGGGKIECDTFFPVSIGEGESLGITQKLASPEDVRQWVGEEVPQSQAMDGNVAKNDEADDKMGAWLEEGEMQIRVLGWEMQKTRE
jgi:dihydrofolate reductase